MGMRLGQHPPLASAVEEASAEASGHGRLEDELVLQCQQARAGAGVAQKNRPVSRSLMPLSNQPENELSGGGFVRSVSATYVCINTKFGIGSKISLMKHGGVHPRGGLEPTRGLGRLPQQQNAHPYPVPAPCPGRCHPQVADYHRGPR